MERVDCFVWEIMRDLLVFPVCQLRLTNLHRGFLTCGAANIEPGTRVSICDHFQVSHRFGKMFFED